MDITPAVIDKAKSFFIGKPLSFYLALAAGAYLIPKAVGADIYMKNISDASSSASSLKNIENMMRMSAPGMAIQPKKDNYPY
jgi:hypothetical protein